MLDLSNDIPISDGVRMLQLSGIWAVKNRRSDSLSVTGMFFQVIGMILNDEGAVQKFLSDLIVGNLWH
jgi:hypothetical protein